MAIYIKDSVLVFYEAKQMVYEKSENLKKITGLVYESIHADGRKWFTHALDVFEAYEKQEGEEKFNESLLDTLRELGSCLEGWLPKEKQEELYKKNFGED